MFKSLFEPTIRDTRELRRYVLTITGICVAATLTVDILTHLLFYVDWTDSIRSWTETFFEAGGLSFGASLGVGRTNLKLYQALQVAEREGRIDHLTGLFNRRALMEKVADADEIIQILAIVDIDLFKRVNDIYGHLAGDAVIAGVGKLMAEELSNIGTLARVGGEEFALAACKVPSAEIEARLDATRRRTAETPFRFGERSAQITVSIGLATALPGDSFEQLYAKADRALYVAKAGGRNRLLRFDQIEILKNRQWPGGPRRQAHSAATAVSGGSLGTASKFPPRFPGSNR